MACLIKRPDSGFWIASFTNPQGKRLKKSTKIKATERKRKEAQAVADGYEEAAKKERTKTQTRKVIEELHEKVTGEPMVVISLRQFVESWLANKEARTSRATMVFYRNMWRKAALFFGERVDEDITKIRREDIYNFTNQEAKTLSPRTVNHELKWLKMVFRRARLDDLIGKDPCEAVEPISVHDNEETTRRRAMTVAEIRRIIAVADPEWKSMILFGLYTGQRLIDLATLTWANIDLISSKLKLTQKKTRKRIILPIAGPLETHITTLEAGDEPDAPLHPRAFDTVQRLGRTNNLSAQFTNLMARAGLRKPQPHKKTHGLGNGIGNSKSGISFHSLRHSAVSFMMDAGIPQSVVMEMVGHDSIEISRYYTHAGEEAMIRAAESFPDLVATVMKKPRKTKKK